MVSRSRAADARASSSPHAASRIRAQRVDNNAQGDEQQSSQPDAESRRPYQYQYAQEHHAAEQYRHAVHQQQRTRARSRSSPSSILDAPTQSRPQHHHQSVHHRSHHDALSGSSASAVHWLQQQRERNAHKSAPSVHLQHYGYRDDQEDAQRNAPEQQRFHQVDQRLTTTYAYQEAVQYQQEVDVFDHQQHQHVDILRRSFTGKRKASDPDSDLAVDDGYSAYSTYDNVYLTAPLSVGSSDRLDRLAVDASSATSASATSTMQTRRSLSPYPQSPYTPQQHYLHAAQSSSSDSRQQQPWLHHPAEEDETKESYHFQHRVELHRQRSETSLSPPLARPPHASSSPPQAFSGRQQPQPAAAEVTLLSQARVITNASRNITFEMLQPHFERPLQEAAQRFGVCTTLMKKICRRTGITSWPFRRICGLHKSIASMEKQVHYFDGEQKRSYAEQLYKLELELAAFLRTGNALTPEFEALVAAEGGLDEAAGLGLGPGQQQQEQLGNHAEAKTEGVEIAVSYSYDGEEEDEGATLSPPTLSAVATRVSVSSFTYTSPTTQAAQDSAQSFQGGSTQSTGMRHVMAAALDLGYDDSPERHQQQQQHAQPLARHRHAVAEHPGPRAALSGSRYLAQGPMQRALPSLSFMLRRQSLSRPSQQDQADDGTATPQFYHQRSRGDTQN